MNYILNINNDHYLNIVRFTLSDHTLAEQVAERIKENYHNHTFLLENIIAHADPLEVLKFDSPRNQATIDLYNALQLYKEGYLDLTPEDTYRYMSELFSALYLIDGRWRKYIKKVNGYPSIPVPAPFTPETTYNEIIDYLKRYRRVNPDITGYDINYLLGDAETLDQESIKLEPFNIPYVTENNQSFYLEQLSEGSITISFITKDATANIFAELFIQSPLLKDHLTDLNIVAVNNEKGSDTVYDIENEQSAVYPLDEERDNLYDIIELLNMEAEYVINLDQDEYTE